MKQIYKNSPQSRTRDWLQILSLKVLLLLFAMAIEVKAQEGSQGNTTIFGGAQMTFFGNHNFLTGGSGAQPGVILTERATANISYLNFSGANLTSTGADNSNYVDGYVRKYGTGQFIFPVGDNANVGQFAASADGTSGAYFHTDATTAVTSNLFTGSNYPALPAGGPFPTTSVGTGVGTVSKIEYWDIDGATATPITLTWDASSDIALLTNSTLGKLTIVGWNPGTNKWESIASDVDVTSVLGGTSGLGAGSITSTTTVVPNTYSAYTLAGRAASDLTPFITISPNVMAGPTTFDTRIRILNLNTASTFPTTGATITVRILKNNTRWTFTWNPSATSNSLGALNNSVWTYSGNVLYHIWTTTQVIAKGSSRYIGFTSAFTPGSQTGQLPITVTIDYPSGGEDNNQNQTDVEVATFYP